MRVFEERPEVKRKLDLSVLDKSVQGKYKGLAYPRANKFGISKSDEACVAGVDPWGKLQLCHGYNYGKLKVRV